MDDQHEMHLEATHPSGAEEWACPTCGRRFLMQWPPEYKKVVLEKGDAAATHTGSKGGLSIGAATVIQHSADETAKGYAANTDALPVGDIIETGDIESAENLRPWLNWLQKANLDKHLDDIS